MERAEADRDTERVPRNFITDIIDADRAAGRVTQVVTRFPPEPNGYLHIGHVKSICLNFGLARDYGGRCNLRFDDTNPEKESPEYFRAIEDDVRWLGFEWQAECHSSDYFPRLYAYAVELINKGLAYVDELSPDEIRLYRGTLTAPGRPSPYRERPAAENLRLFAAMRDGQFAEGRACLRAKIDMGSPFICMRDPVIYRIKHAAHARTGTQWCVYPMYDFTHCISDALEGVTHSICTLEFQDNRRLYDWVLGHITIDARPHQYEMSRLNLEYALTSKRKLNLLVERGVVDGWDDPRLVTISGLRRRGYTPRSLREFCRRIGVTKQDNLVEMAALEACVREDLNEHAPRAMAVLRPLRLVIDNYDEDGVRVGQFTVANHPQHPEMGRRAVTFGRELWIEQDDFSLTPPAHFKRLAPDAEVRLRYGPIVRAVGYERDASGAVTAVHVRAVPHSCGANPPDHRPRGVIHWVAAAAAVRAPVRLYAPLFTDPNPGAAADLMAILNPRSAETLTAMIEPALGEATSGQSFQFERLGYFCVDSRDSRPGAPAFNLVVGLRDNNKKGAGTARG